MGVLNKDEFINAMNELKKFWDFENDLNTMIYEHCSGGYIFFPDVISVTIKVLAKMFGDNDEWIDYYVWELCFGRKWKSGMITNEDGSDCKLQSLDDLYTLLLENYKNE